VVIFSLGDYFLASFLSYKSYDLARVELNGDFRALVVKISFRRLVFIIIHLARVELNARLIRFRLIHLFLFLLFCCI
jgi:hypothetical protein